MNSTTANFDDTQNQADYDQYRVLSIGAISSFILSLVSLPVIFFIWLLPIPVVGFILGFVSRKNIRDRSSELTGLGLATIGTVLSGLIVLASIGITAGIYLTEVPDGYERVSWFELQPDPERPGLPVSPASIEMNGQRVFVKGYTYPDESGAELQQFVLVPDMGTCCFGGQPKLTDMIEVTLKEPLRVRYSRKLRRLGGVLKVDKQKKPVSGLDGVYYQLEADYLK